MYSERQNKNYESATGTLTYSLSTADQCYVYFDILDSITISPGETLATEIRKLGYSNTMSEDGSWGIMNENGFRYEGEDPSNYVCFGSEDTTCPEDNLYRIIGSFETEYDSDENGIAESIGYLTKIQKHTMYGGATMAYHSTYEGTSTNSHYPNSEIYPILNTNWYGGLDSGYQNQITNVNWKLGAVPYSSIPLIVADFYTHERGTTVNDGVAEYEKVFKIGMMYPSDYGYGVLSSNCARTTALYSYDGTPNCYGLNWLHDSSNHQWTMAASIWPSRSVSFGVSANGKVGGSSTELSKTVRPAFYLNPDTKITGGTGTSTDPYRIAL